MKFSKPIAMLAVIGAALLAQAGVTVSQPANGATVPLKMHVVASATPASGHRIDAMQIVVNSVKVYSTSASSLDTYVTVKSGSDRVQVKAWDSGGNYFEKLLYVSGSSSTSASTTTTSSSSSTSSTSVSTSSGGTTISNIDQRSGWFSCTTCAGSNAAGTTASYWMKTGVSSPSMDGKSAEFHLGGSIPYSDALWSQTLSSSSGTISGLHHFVNDLYFYYTDATAAQGFEFNITQYYGGKGYVYGMQCNLRSGAGPHWDISVPKDYSKPLTLTNMKWQNTGVACNPSTYKWNHVTLEFARTSTNKVQFVSLTLNGSTHYINVTVPARIAPSSWLGLNTHFQMNGNYTQTSYTAYVDKWSVRYW